uniref:VirD4-like conjugal transfer protein, CD1115 family n=1 Tax=Carnobacterium sp. TaxID=48221 RepID=UPI00344E9AFA
MILNKLKKKKYLSHTYSYEVDGEDLPEKQSKKLNKQALVLSITAMLVFLIAINWIVGSYKLLASELKMVSTENTSIFDYMKVDWGESFKIGNMFVPSLHYKLFLFLLLIGIVIAFIIYTKLNYKSEGEIAYGQKGDSRFTTIEEIENQYTEIPEKKKNFKGIGGIPISHHRDKYYIDTDTVNSCILGVSRSGKGEIIITPMIDILSRAENRSSMVLNDPKGELFAGSKDTLEKRGYDVQVLNLKDPLQSMSYNPLQLVKEAWLRGDEQGAGKLANSVAFTLYNDPNAGENAFFNDGAQNAVTAIIIALVEYCYDNDCPEKITMYNVAEMLNELGTEYFKEDPSDMTEKNALDEYFKSLPQGHVAKKRYGSTSFAGEKTRGSILSTANQGLQPFVDPLFARMTSKNSIDLKQIGFSKYLNGQLDNSFMNERIEVNFHKNNKEKSVIGKNKVKVKAEGMFDLNFDENLEDGDLCLIKYEDVEAEQSYKLIYQISFEEELDKKGRVIYQEIDGKGKVKEYKRKTIVKQLVNTFPNIKKEIQMNYSDKPTAVFMIIPDYDSSNHTLASIFTKQLYTELASNCAETKGSKCFTRVQFILDEFGNMPPIDDMDQVMTVCLGRNIIFNLVVQSYSQIKRKYGEGAETIKENCQNHIYIMSTNMDTIEEISKKAGHKTLISQSSSEKHLEMDNSLNKSADQERIITFDRLSQLIQGETLVIRSLHRLDKNNRKVRPYPIFNSRETNMPFRFEFLSEWIDTNKALNDIDIKSEHSNLILSSLNVDFSEFIFDRQAKMKYIDSNKKASEKKQRSKIVKEVKESREDKLKRNISELKQILIDFEDGKEKMYIPLQNNITDFENNNKEMQIGILNSVCKRSNNQKIKNKIKQILEIREGD